MVRAPSLRLPDPAGCRAAGCRNSEVLPKRLLTWNIFLESGRQEVFAIISAIRYPAWWTYKKQWKITMLLMGKSWNIHYKWPFSIAMLVHQRVWWLIWWLIWCWYGKFKSQILEQNSSWSNVFLQSHGTSWWWQLDCASTKTPPNGFGEGASMRPRTWSCPPRCSRNWVEGNICRKVITVNIHKSWERPWFPPNVPLNSCETNLLTYWLIIPAWFQPWHNCQQRCFQHVEETNCLGHNNCTYVDWKQTVRMYLFFWKQTVCFY